jgi:hypothetical protein
MQKAMGYMNLLTLYFFNFFFLALITHSITLHQAIIGQPEDVYRLGFNYYISPKTCQLGFFLSMA